MDGEDDDDWQMMLLNKICSFLYYAIRAIHSPKTKEMWNDWKEMDYGFLIEENCLTVGRNPVI